MDAKTCERKTEVLPPETRIVVTPGNMALFYLDYDLPESCRTYLLFEPNFDEDVLGTNPFSTCPSKPLVGKGSGERYFLLGDRQYGDNGQLVRDGKYEKDLLVKSAKDEDE